MFKVSHLFTREAHEPSSYFSDRTGLVSVFCQALLSDPKGFAAMASMLANRVGIKFCWHCGFCTVPLTWPTFIL